MSTAGNVSTGTDVRRCDDTGGSLVGNLNAWSLADACDVTVVPVGGRAGDRPLDALLGVPLPVCPEESEQQGII